MEKLALPSATRSPQKGREMGRQKGAQAASWVREAAALQASVRPRRIAVTSHPPRPMACLLQYLSRPDAQYILCMTLWLSLALCLSVCLSFYLSLSLHPSLPPSPPDPLQRKEEGASARDGAAKDDADRGARSAT